MTYRVEVLQDEEDKKWFAEVAAVRMLQEELKRPELVNLSRIHELVEVGCKSGTHFIVKEGETPVGALGSLFVPNLYNPEYVTLAELFWYVLPEYRNSRAGYLLLKAFDEKATEANDATMSLLPSSEVKGLSKMGYELVEFGYRKGV